MPDDTSPQDPGAQEPSAEASADTEPTPSAAPAPAAAPPAERKGVFVPRWLAILLGLVLAVALVGGGGFALGRSTADDDHHARVDDRRPDQRPGRPNGQPGDQPDGQGDRRELPTPRGDQPVPSGGVVLGVVVEPAGDGATGARIVEVAPGSAAADAGLESGDVITQVDDAAVDDPAALASAIREHADGDEVTLTYERDGTTATVTVTLTAKTPSAFPSTSPPA